MDDGGPNPAEVAETPLELRAALRLRVRDNHRASRHDRNEARAISFHDCMFMYHLCIYIIAIIES
jgi:hypothetical protein